MTEPTAMSDLDLAALVSSRICHDVINPVAAIANGLEMLDEEPDQSMRDAAMDLIRKSALQASAKLQFARLAFGAAGSAGAEIDLRDAEKVAREFVQGTGKHQVLWQGPAVTLPKNKVKLLLNLVALGGIALPRGGVVNVAVLGTPPEVSQGRCRQTDRPSEEPAARRQRNGDRCPFDPALLRQPGGGGFGHEGHGRGPRRRGRVQGRLTQESALLTRNSRACSERLRGAWGAGQFGARWRWRMD
jgi:histidine phosphotransferase ChpT